MLLLLAAVAVAALSQLALGPLYRRQQEQQQEQQQQQQQQQVLLVTGTQWTPYQLGSDVMLLLLVLLSCWRWKQLQQELRAAVLLRFASCLLFGLVLRLLLSLSLSEVYMHRGAAVLLQHPSSSSSVESLLLALRFVFGCCLPSNVDAAPSFSCMLVVQLFIFGCTYSSCWGPPLQLLQLLQLLLITAASAASCFCSVWGGIRSSFEWLLAFAVAACCCCCYHLLLYAATNSLFTRLRAQLQTKEYAQQQQLLQQLQQQQQDHHVVVLQHIPQQQHKKKKKHTSAAKEAAAMTPTATTATTAAAASSAAAAAGFWLSLLRGLYRLVLHLEAAKERVLYCLLPPQASMLQRSCSATPLRQQQQQLQHKLHRLQSDEGLPVAKRLPFASAAAAAAAAAGEEEQQMLEDQQLLQAISRCCFVQGAAAAAAGVRFQRGLGCMYTCSDEEEAAAAPNAAATAL